MTSLVAEDPRLTQRMTALARANDIRFRRADLKKDLKSGETSIVEILQNPPSFIGTMRVYDLLAAVPRLGRVKIMRLLRQCNIKDGRRIKDLSDRQRNELIELLRPTPN